VLSVLLRETISGGEDERMDPITLIVTALAGDHNVQVNRFGA
jgi:hypothetical protein